MTVLLPAEVAWHVNSLSCRKKWHGTNFDPRRGHIGLSERSSSCDRKIYPDEKWALKITFLAIREASKKWTMPIRNWKTALNHFAILFQDRLPVRLP